MSKERINHDGLFKELLNNFFEEFMILFFPEACEEIDFNHTVFLSQELIRDIFKGEKKVVDLLIETKLKGKDGFILVHIESQSYEQIDFNERMFYYFTRLYDEHRKQILPIAIFGYDKLKNVPNTFSIGFPFLEVLNFQFLKVELKSQNWREYLKQDNPVAAALLSKMGYSDEERVQVKKEFLRMLVRLELDPVRTELIAGFFETYLKLTSDEEKQLYDEIKSLGREEEEKVMQITTSWHEKGREEGVKKGIEVGKEEGIKEGIKVGKKEGKKEALIEVAQSMLKDGYTVEQIERLTKLSKETIKNLIH
ncbi:Rpn family recombination-promoting nuclease/putative transposase [Schinkia azotoformans]|uniref:Rpn family recombination-promoting nuclease/putative transposase n=1 Tax=Schinkia azotoformans TaxID=1454 RepID=UPI002E1A1082|nr:Rpn family recombination-promoting nuclease/putative transposase [Schinkia azotoformans]